MKDKSLIDIRDHEGNLLRKVSTVDAQKIVDCGAGSWRGKHAVWLKWIDREGN